MEKLNKIYESVLSESNLEVGDTIYHPKYGNGVLTFVPGEKSYLRDTAKADFGDNKGQPVKIKDLKKESLSEAFNFTSPYDIQKFLKSNKNFAKEWSVEDMAAFTKQDVKVIKRLAQNAFAQNLVNFNNGKYSDLKESLSEDFKMGDIVSFTDPDWKKTYGNSKYEVGIVTSSGKIKLQDIKTKQRLPYTFEPTSLKKESLSSESVYSEGYKIYKNPYDEYTVVDTQTRRMPSGDLGFDSPKKAQKMIDWLNKNPNASIVQMDNEAKKIKKESLSSESVCKEDISPESNKAIIRFPSELSANRAHFYIVKILGIKGVSQQFINGDLLHVPKDKLDIIISELKNQNIKYGKIIKESLSSESINESMDTDLYNKFKKIDSNIIQSLRELREFVAKYYPRLVGNVRNVVDKYSDAVYDIEYNLSHSKESLSKLDNLYESVLKEGNGFLDYKGDWRGDNVKYLENDYKLWDNPQKYLPELKDFVKKIDYAISQNKDSPLIMASFEKSKNEADNLIKYFEDIIPITKQITKGKSIEDVKSILKKSKYWNWSDRDLMNNNAKVRGPMDLYIDFEDDKVVKYNF